MKVLRILLILTLVAVAGLYGFSTLSLQLQGSNIGPVISCDTDTLDISVHDDRSVLLQGVTAKDRQDGDLTGRIFISGISKMVNHTARVTYLVFDSDQNVSTLERTIRYTDYTSPRFQILSPLVYTSTDSVALLDRLKVEDALDGDITGSVRVSFMNTTDNPDIFHVDLQVTNSAGDTARVTLPIIREASNSPGSIVLDTYLIYLDQGASFNPRAHLTRVNLNDADVSPATQDVTITGTADTSTPGTYYITYTYLYENMPIQSVLTVVVE